MEGLRGSYDKAQASAPEEDPGACEIWKKSQGWGQISRSPPERAQYEAHAHACVRIPVKQDFEKACQQGVQGHLKTGQETDKLHHVLDPSHEG